LIPLSTINNSLPEILNIETVAFTAEGKWYSIEVVELNGFGNGSER
jgi:hypothetical protein